MNYQEKLIIDLKSSFEKLSGNLKINWQLAIGHFYSNLNEFNGIAISSPEKLTGEFGILIEHIGKEGEILSEQILFKVQDFYSKVYYLDLFIKTEIAKKDKEESKEEINSFKILFDSFDDFLQKLENTLQEYYPDFKIYDFCLDYFDDQITPPLKTLSENFDNLLKNMKPDQGIINHNSTFHNLCENDIQHEIKELSNKIQILFDTIYSLRDILNSSDLNFEFIQEHQLFLKISYVREILITSDKEISQSLYHCKSVYSTMREEEMEINDDVKFIQENIFDKADLINNNAASFGMCIKLADTRLLKKSSNQIQSSNSAIPFAGLASLYFIRKLFRVNNRISQSSLPQEDYQRMIEQSESTIGEVKNTCKNLGAITLDEIISDLRCIANLAKSLNSKMKEKMHKGVHLFGVSSISLNNPDHDGEQGLLELTQFIPKM
jgi:hypothetical protein